MVHSQTRLRKHAQEKKPPEIVVQDFGEDMFDLGTPKDAEHMYKFVLSPRQSPASAKWSNGLDMNWLDGGKLKIPYDTNSCVLLSPSPSARTGSEFENWDTIFQANGAEDLLNGPEKGLTDSFLMELGLKSPHSKVTLFSPKCPTSLFSENFFKEIGLNNEGVTLLSPKAPNLISTKTPVVVKRQNEGKCEFGIYLPPCYTPALVDTIQSTINQDDLTMFPFPPVSDDSVSDCSHNDDNDMDIPASTNFFTSIQPENITKQQASFFEANNNDMDNINNNDISNIGNINSSNINNNNINNNNLTTHMFTQQPGPCSVIQDGSSLAGTYFNHLAAGSSSSGHSVLRSHSRRNVEAKEKKARECKKQFKEVRVLHNDVERKRRGEMHSRFQKLRESIPELENDKKAAKISILKVAKRYIRDLEEEGSKMEQIKEYEKRRNRELLDKLCGLTGTSMVRS